MSKRPTGHARRKAVAYILSLSDICHLCGHPGARQADDVIPRSRGGDPNDPNNLLPAHGGNRREIDNPCPTCGKRCNQSRGNRMLIPNRVRSRDW